MFSDLNDFTIAKGAKKLPHPLKKRRRATKQRGERNVV